MITFDVLSKIIFSSSFANKQMVYKKKEGNASRGFGFGDGATDGRTNATENVFSLSGKWKGLM